MGPLIHPPFAACGIAPPIAAFGVVPFPPIFITASRILDSNPFTVCSPPSNKSEIASDAPVATPTIAVPAFLTPFNANPDTFLNTEFGTPNIDAIGAKTPPNNICIGPGKNAPNKLPIMPIAETNPIPTALNGNRIAFESACCNC